MKKVKNYDIDKIIELSKEMEKDRHNLQIEIKDRNLNRDFIIFLEDIAEVTLIDELKGYHREASDKSFDMLIDNVDLSKGLGCGIKIYNKPSMRLNKWEKWDGGYIEGFIRVDPYFIIMERETHSSRSVDGR